MQSVMAAYLLTYGVSQLFYGPLSDRVGDAGYSGRHVYLMLATLVAITTHSLTVLIVASAIQGMAPASVASWHEPCRAICTKARS
nr:multidrug resistance protein D [Raoultella sp. NCTC 9187]